jgi:hypothetical protein
MIAGRVVMLSRDQGLASIVGEIVGRGQPLTRFSSPAEVPDWLRPPTGAVVLDYPKPARVIVYRQLRQRYLGPVLALLDPDEDTSGLPTDHGRIGVLYRPFTGEDLTASLDALAGSRNEALRPKSSSLTAPPLGTDAAPLDVSAVFASTPASLRARHAAGGPAVVAVGGRGLRITPAPGAAAGGRAVPAVVGVPAPRVAGLRVETVRRRRGLGWRHADPTARRRVNSLVLTLAAGAALVLGATLSDGGGCGSAGCGNVARAIGNGGAGRPPVTPDPATPAPEAQPPAGSSKAAAEGAAAAGTDPAPGPNVVIPIASGVDDLINGTSSSSGGAPLLIVAPAASSGGSGSTTSSGSGGSSGGSGGGVSTTTLPTSTTSPTPTTTAPPPTTAPPTTTSPPPTDPPTTAPPTTEPATTAPPTTEPPTTEAPTTAPPPTDPPPTTATTSATTDTT